MKNWQYVQAAKRLYHEEGEIEVDDSARVSSHALGGDEGTYVQAWVWVPDAEAKKQRRGK